MGGGNNGWNMYCFSSMAIFWYLCDILMDNSVLGGPIMLVPMLDFVGVSLIHPAPIKGWALKRLSGGNLRVVV